MILLKLTIFILQLKLAIAVITQEIQSQELTLTKISFGRTTKSSKHATPL